VACPNALKPIGFPEEARAGREIAMNPLGGLAYIAFQLINIYEIVLVIHVVLSLLVGFNVVNPRNQFVAAIWRVTYAMCEPLLGRIRRYVPSFGGIDFSPVILIVVLQAFNNYIILPLTY
jgi:YggT family protein